ncbi:MAG: beta-Ala-His dipeptidase [Bacteroidetes bacterium]|jgi:dipeptidase D|nr:beta-Ala-His dipeptidase [Bacteroidota bacterium]
MKITELQPTILWKHFYELTQIPRPSKHEDKVVKYVINTANNLGLAYNTDDVSNVVVRKPATAGMENKKTIVLQSHVDMVPQKNNDKVHDFQKDPIQTMIQGEWVTADGTTLGADNGIGVAAMLAVLEDNTLKHGPIECLFTVDEETGMTGAFALKEGFLKGDVLLNLDSEDEGELFVGCAGGMEGTFTFQALKSTVPANNIGLHIAVKGLKGGHSGMDINLGRANANKVMVRALLKILENYDVYVEKIAGGNLRNAIPREAFATIWVNPENCREIEDNLQQQFLTIASEYKLAEPDFHFEIDEHKELAKKAFEGIVIEPFMKALLALPNGVIRTDKTMDNGVETSSNLAAIKTTDTGIQAQCLLRSSVDSAKHALSDRMKAIFDLIGAASSFAGDYPGWRPNPHSGIREIMKPVCKDVYGHDPEIKAVHAGLECGIIGSVYKNMDMISFGPTIVAPHSPDEKVHIESVERFWKVLIRALEAVE